MTAQPELEFSVCVFRIAGKNFGIRLESIREIVPMAALSRPPSMPSILEGFLNLGGAAVPVVRLANLLGLPQAPLDLYTPLILLRDNGLPLALLVNQVTGIVSVAAGGLAFLAETDSFNGCVVGAVTDDGETVHILAIDQLLLAKEQRTLMDFQVIETGRLRHLEQAPS